MKKLLLLITVFTAYVTSTAQPAYVELRLLDSEIGQPEWNGDISTNISNDAGLNQILQQYEVMQFRRKLNHPYPGLTNRIIEAVCNINDAGALAGALSQYTEVVESAHVSAYGLFGDVLIAQILTAGVGVPLASDGSPVVTNDAGLNSIFSAHNVYYVAPFAPFSTNESLLRVYYVVCNCDNVLLKAALDNYAAVIENTEYAPVGYELSTADFEQKKAVVYPNPFSDKLEIRTDQLIEAYAMFDITGKNLFSSSSEVALNRMIPKLPPGLYILNLTFEDGSSSSNELIKR
ncbi:MAG TPA: T9SS type A sorting domain-containing protein [Flavobacterium sp.]|jgi:hypothetical protein